MPIKIEFLFILFEFIDAELIVKFLFIILFFISSSKILVLIELDKDKFFFLIALRIWILSEKNFLFLYS